MRRISGVLFVFLIFSLAPVAAQSPQYRHGGPPPAQDECPQGREIRAKKFYPTTMTDCQVLDADTAAENQRLYRDRTGNPVSQQPIVPAAPAAPSVKLDGSREPLVNSDCERTMKSHGFLSRAQFQCGFDDYSADMMEKAKGCAQQIDKAAVSEALKEGASVFDANEQKQGHVQICGDILRDFSNVVRLRPTPKLEPNEKLTQRDIERETLRLNLMEPATMKLRACVRSKVLDAYSSGVYGNDQAYKFFGRECYSDYSTAMNLLSLQDLAESSFKLIVLQELGK
jgi:hypothetical protein